jgi:hypothetical protein
MNGNLRPLLMGDTRATGQQAELLAFLHQRDAKLKRVENGGWWRLRRRLLPALRVYWRLRQPKQP